MSESNIFITEGFQSKDRIYTDDELRGEIIGIKRIPYFHYGIYTGNNKVIHYVRQDNMEASAVRSTDISYFLKDNNEFFFVNFKKPVLTIRHTLKYLPYAHKIQFRLNTLEKIKKNVKVNSKDSTIQKAQELLYYEGYKLLSKNCEHFAYYCKTNNWDSLQVNDLGGIILNPLGQLIRFNPYLLFLSSTFKIGFETTFVKLRKNTLSNP